jgi:hypothetical protein
MNALTHGLTRHLARAVAALALTSLGGAALAQTVAFTATYKGGTSSLCSSTYNIKGAEPSTAGKYPVYIHTGGTGEAYDSGIAMEAVNRMAAKGFVAASVAYANSTFGSCSAIGSKARCIFNPSSTSSAVAALCARAKADCSKGIVTGGLSQGSIVSVLARNTDSRVRASMGQGAGTNYSIYDLSSCMKDGGHTQTADRIRLINGEKDVFVGPTALSVRTANQAITGLSCGSTATSCFRANGSGWYIVKDAEVSDGEADHCFMLNGGCSGASTDAGYKSGSAAWQLEATLNWLKTYTNP